MVCAVIEKMHPLLKGLGLLVYAALVAYVSLKPSGGEGLPLWDKAMHFTIYAIFALLGSSLCRSQAQLWWMAAAILLYGAALELAQSFTGRDMSALDILANGIGIGVALLLLRSQGTDQVATVHGQGHTVDE